MSDVNVGLKVWDLASSMMQLPVGAEGDLPCPTEFALWGTAALSRGSARSSGGGSFGIATDAQQQDLVFLFCIAERLFVLRSFGAPLFY